MAFLDNSGDIILDAVLTDAGRERLARGDGSFKITKFSLGDDEINYTLYNTSAATGQKDLQIMQTPILEAFTNNTSLMKSKLISIPRTNLLYLPVILLNQSLGVAKDTTTDSILITVDETTTDNITTGQYLNGYETTSGQILRVDQGLNNNAVAATIDLDTDLVETQYMVEIDNRLGQLATSDGTPSPVSFVDDDSIASYYFSMGTGRNGVTPTPANGYVFENTVTGDGPDQVIAGPRGTYLQFKIKASQNLNSSTYLFTLLGNEFSFLGNTYYYIDTSVRITGATTGYRIDVPLRFIKQQ